jgi:hypothetical protein
MEPVAVAFAVIIVVVAVILFGGFYLRASQPQATQTPTPVPETSMITEIPTTLPPVVETAAPTPEITTPEPTPTQDRTYAAPATPYNDKKYYMLPYKSSVYNPKGNLPPVIYHATYSGKFQSEAVVAHVLQAPLIVDFILTSSQSPTRSFFYLTVRNNKTEELLAQEGFYGPYTIDSGKRFYFSSPGDYHINMYGGFVTVDLTLRAR